MGRNEPVTQTFMLLSFVAAGLMLASQVYSGVAEGAGAEPGRSLSLASLWPFGRAADVPPSTTPAMATHAAPPTLSTAVAADGSPSQPVAAQPSTQAAPSTSPPSSASPSSPLPQSTLPPSNGQTPALGETAIAPSQAPVQPQAHAQVTTTTGRVDSGNRLGALLPLARQATQAIPPEEQLHLVVDLSDRQVYFYRDAMLQATYRIAVGREGWETPVGEFRVLEKQVDPTWRHPFTGKLVPPGPDNPLGSRWIGFWTDGTDQIGFHGTSQTQFIGQAVSHGCIRMHEVDIQALYPLLEVGTPVTVRP